MLFRSLVKITQVFDMSDFSYFNLNIKVFRALGNTSKKSAIYYPQLVGNKIFVNTPIIIKSCMKIFNKFQSINALSMQHVCNKNCNESTCPILSYDAKDLPEFIGGTSKNFKPMF